MNEAQTKALLGVRKQIESLTALQNGTVNHIVTQACQQIDRIIANQVKQAEPVAYMQVYRCKIKSKARIDREIPREKQGWWADIAAGGLIRLRQANQADIDRCTLNDAHSQNPNDYMCETFKNGSLVAKIALEYMNPDENVFAQVYTHPAPAVAVNEQMLNALKMVMDDPQSLEGRPRTFECVVEAIAAAEAAKGGV